MNDHTRKLYALFYCTLSQNSKVVLNRGYLTIHAKNFFIMKMGAGEKCFLSTIKTFVWRKNSLQKQPPEVFYEDKCS